MTHVHAGLAAVRAVEKLIPDDECPSCGAELGFFDGDVCGDCKERAERTEPERESWWSW